MQDRPRKKAEKKGILVQNQDLNESEEKYRTLFNSIDEGFCIIEMIFDAKNKPVDYRFLEINPAFEKQTGLHQAEGKLMRSLAPEHEEHWFQTYGRIALTGKSERFVNEARTLNRWYEVYAFRVGIPESRKVAILFNDITKRKKAEEELARVKDELEIKVRERTAELQTSEEKYHSIVETADEGIWICDMNAKTIFVNKKMTEMIGYSEQQMMGKTPYEFMGEEAKDLAKSNLARRLKGHCDRYEQKYIRKDGSTLWAIASATPLLNKSGHVVASLGMITDITARKKTEQSLQENQQNLETLADTVTTGIGVIGIPDGKFLYVNSAYEKAFGYDHDELIGRTTPDIYWDIEDRKRILELLKKTGNKADYDVRLKKKDGTMFWGMSSVRPVNFNCRPALLGIFTDISDRKMAEERFSKAFHSSPVALSISRISDGIFLDINQSFLNLFGYNREEVVGQKATDLKIYYDPTDRKEIVRLLEQEGKVFNHEVSAMTKTGTEIRALTSAEKIEIDGQLSIIWTTIDITERNKAEERLKESEERFFKAFHLSPVGMVIASIPEGRWVEVNDSFLRMLEYTRDEVIGHTSSDLKLYAEPTKRDQVWQTILEKGRFENHEMTWRTKTGKVITVISSNERLFLNGQEHAIFIVIDITERKKTEVEVMRLNRELKAIGECDQAIVQENDEQTLLTKVCDILCTTAGYRMAWVGTVEYDEAKSVRPLAWYGDQEYLIKANITWADTERGRGPTGLAARTGKTHFFQDFATEPAAAPWRKSALSLGYRSSIAIPLLDNDGNVFEVFTLYSTESNYFNPAEIRLLEELAGDLSFGINALHEKVKRQQAEAEISHLASFPELNPNPIVELDAEGGVKYANPAAKTHFPLMTQGNKHQFLMDFINSLKKTGTNSITKDIKIGDSWYEETLVLVSSTKNYMLYARDITGRKNAEVALQETQDYLNSLLNYANAPIIVWDPLFHITQFNRAFERLTGRAAEDVIGTHLDILFPEEQKAHAMEHIRRAVSGERMEVEEISIQHKDGFVRTVLWNSATLYAQDNKTTLATIAQGQDITERKAAEDELKQRTIDLEASNKELESFSYSVSHDLRAPLRSITGFSNVLLEDYSDELDNEGKSYLKKISDSGELMGQLMDDLLKLSRVTRGDLTMEKLDLSNMAQKIISDLVKDEPKRKVKVTIAPNMSANGDKNLLGLVLQNLLGNAWKYTGKTAEPRIEMGIVEHNGKQAYFVRDNGVGFDMAYANKLFQPFQRLHNASEFAGTGIGLATVQRIIRRHGGEVWAEGKVGEGATFYFTLNIIAAN